MRYLLIAIILLAGCEPVGERPKETFAVDESRYKFLILIDMSLSFGDLMADGGKAYDFLLELIDTYFRDTVGSSDRIVIAQASAKQPFLIFEGTPLELRQQFDPQKFGAFLRDHSDPNGSPIHEGLARSLEYLMADANVSAGKAKPVCFVLSDMDDNFPRTPELKQRILQDLKNYGELDGVLGIYYCDEDKLLPWKRALSNAGINGHVECSIVSKPSLPSFE